MASLPSRSSSSEATSSAERFDSRDCATAVATVSSAAPLTAPHQSISQLAPSCHRHRDVILQHACLMLIQDVQCISAWVCWSLKNACTLSWQAAYLCVSCQVLVQCEKKVCQAHGMQHACAQHCPVGSHGHTTSAQHVHDEPTSVLQWKPQDLELKLLHPDPASTK